MHVSQHLGLAGTECGGSACRACAHQVMARFHFRGDVIPWPCSCGAGAGQAGEASCALSDGSAGKIAFTVRCLSAVDSDRDERERGSNQ
jgi:hypothetical protein